MPSPTIRRESPAPEVCGESIIEPYFVDLRINRSHDLSQRFASRLRLRLTSRCRSDDDHRRVFGVVEDWANHLALPFRVAPKLAFDEHRQAGWRNHEVVDRPGSVFRSVQIGPGAENIGSISAMGKHVRMRVDKRLDVGFAHRVAPLLRLSDVRGTAPPAPKVKRTGVPCCRCRANRSSLIGRATAGPLLSVSECWTHAYRPYIIRCGKENV